MSSNDISMRSEQGGTQKSTKAPLPLLALAIGMLASYLPGLLPEGLGVTISYLGWIVPLVACAHHLLQTPRRIAFPLKIWGLWALWVFVYAIFAEASNVLQRSVMLLTPLVVGAAFSTLSLGSSQLIQFNAWLNRFLWVFFAAAGVSTGLLVGGQLNSTSGFAAGSITASLLAAWYAVQFVTYGGKRVLIYWAVLAAVPVLANTRTGMLAVAITLPLTLVPWPLKKRLAVLAMLVAAGGVVFQSERIQSKMFFSGQGSLSDAIVGLMETFSGAQDSTTDFATSGRISMSQVLVAGLDESYWFGHGANTTEAISLAITGVTHPHNDWLRLRYEYGHLGTLIFALALVIQTLHAYRRARRLPKNLAVYLYTGATAMLPMAIFMLSDNVILYAAWFGNLQFAMLGIGYGAHKAESLSQSDVRERLQ